MLVSTQSAQKKYNFYIKEFGDIQTSMRDERLQCLKDRRFYSIAGAQWEGALGDQFENKPKFEINKIHLAVIRIINEYRNNRIDVSYIPKDGTKDEQLTDMCNGLYRSDEQDSDAEEARDNAFEESVGGGIGAWRLCSEYEENEDDNDEEGDEERPQRIKWKPIYDADSSVFFDLNAKRQDKSDAKRCYVLTGMSPEAFKEEWEVDPTSIPKLVDQSEFDWASPDVVYVAEVYEIKEVKRKVYKYRGLAGDTKKLSEDEKKTDESKLLAMGYKLSREIKLERKVVEKSIMCGAGILEECGQIPGRYIPVVVTYGKRWFVDNVERCMGHVRLATDVQRLKNMQMSKLAEISAYSTIEKPIFTPEQMAGHAVAWSKDNVENPPYQLINAVRDFEGNLVASGPIGYTKVPNIPPAMGALLQLTDQDIKDLLGNQEAGEEIQNAVSGVAVELVQNKLDMQTYIYISNMAKAIKHEGKIWLSMAKDLMVEHNRKMKMVDKSGEISTVELMRPVLDQTGVMTYENDISKANFEPSVEIGPTSSSKRAAIARSMVGLMQVTTNPQDLEVLSATALMNMEGEGLSDIRDYYRKKLIKIGAVKPTKEEAAELQQELANMPPDPNAEFLKASAIKALADAEKTNADTQLSNAKVHQTNADTAKTISETNQGEITNVLDTVQRLEAGLQSGENATPAP